MISAIVFWGLCTVLLLLPLPFGSDVPWAVFIFECAAFALAAFDLAGGFFARKRVGGVGGNRPARAESLSGPRVEIYAGNGSRFPTYLKVLLLIFLAVTAVQFIPLPPSVLKVISPRTVALYEELGAGGWRTLSFAPALSVSEIVQYLFFGIFAFLIYRHVRTRWRIEAFTLVLLAGGVFQSFYGLAKLFGGSQKIFDFQSDHDFWLATGTYTNHDHFAGLLEMLFALALGYLLAKADFFSKKRDLSLREKAIWFGQERLQKALFCGIIAVIIGLGIVFSRSRSGVFIFIATMVLAAAAVSAGGRAKRSARILLSVAVMVVLAAVVVGIRPVIERFTKENAAKNIRFVFYGNTLKYLRAYPAAGTGLRTFAQIYPMFETKYEPGQLDHAHNDYLEVLAESGVVGGGALILFSLGGVGWIFTRWTKRRDPLVRGIVLGALLGVVAILMHSFTYFNLRNPANAVYFMALFALAARTVDVKE